MLPPYIIDEIRRREQEHQRRHEQPRIELPLPTAPPTDRRHNREDSDKDRGVVIIDLRRVD